MDLHVVQEAVRALKAQGQRVSVRAVHSLTRGSLRDVNRLLRDAREFLDEDEAAELEAEVPEPVQPALGRIREALEAAKAADREAGQASAILDERLAQLRDLREHRPPPAANPEDVADSVSRRFEHDEQVATLVAEVNQLRGIVEAHMAEARSLRGEERKLHERGHQLREHMIPHARRDLADAQAALTVTQQDLEHRMRLAQRRITIQAQALAAYESELRGLIGE